ncbi:hypothetical protein Krac_1440 [Ktedonobacter racemifer DSM 44963]|uniref:Uncharacterized protein n=1 Tax=Ktedonobacter racemifer DSM 44963 TaxID=485913 RepID=D6U1S8_KTERA|nr:hypothetical protein Krac_1440 [Ktedonobacter racemifer DSM 44963]
MLDESSDSIRASANMLLSPTLTIPPGDRFFCHRARGLPIMATFATWSSHFSRSHHHNRRPWQRQKPFARQHTTSNRHRAAVPPHTVPLSTLGTSLPSTLNCCCSSSYYALLFPQNALNTPIREQRGGLFLGHRHSTLLSDRALDQYSLAISL